MNSKDFSHWFNKDRTYFAVGEYAGGEDIPPISLSEILGLRTEEFKPFTNDLLDFFKEQQDFIKLSRGIRAYSQFQDIFPITVDGQNPLLYRHHCYYESLVYLRESIVSWLDGNTLAALTLLRPFLESSLLHLFWDLQSTKKGYNDFYAWLDGKKDKPPVRNQFDFVFSHLTSNDVLPQKKLERRKNLLYKAYKGLCTYNHTPKVEESVINLGNGVGIVSANSLLYYLLSLNLVLRQVVYLYILTYPISLFPVDRYSRWGFTGGGIGLFFDKTNYLLLQAYIGKSNIESTKQDLNQLSEISELLTWFESDPILTHEELEKDWEGFLSSTKSDQQAENMPMRIALYKAFNRASGWALNYVPLNPENNEPSDEKLEQVIYRIDNW